MVVGLGNPGKKYEHTRHNAGFAVVDELARQLSCRFRRSIRFRSRVGKAVAAGGDLLLVKPETYMNNSGSAVAALMRYRKIGAESIIVVVDDADLETGCLRIRPKGGSGGHRGLDSVIAGVKTETFVRVRIGIGRTGEERALVEHVLNRFSAAESRKMAEITVRAAESVLCVLESGVEVAMNRFNAFT